MVNGEEVENWKLVKWSVKEDTGEVDIHGNYLYETKTGLFFQPFIDALDTVPSKSESEHMATKETFHRIAGNFFDVFELSLKQHILDRWRNNKLIVYLLGGDPVLARQFARTLVHHKRRLEEGAIAVDEQTGEEVNADVQQFPPYPNVQHQLGDHHTISEMGGPVRINVKQTMEYLCKNADFKNILENDRFVKRYWTLIEKLADPDNGVTVRLFDRKHGEYSLSYFSPSFSRALTIFSSSPTFSRQGR